MGVGVSVGAGVAVIVGTIGYAGVHELESRMRSIPISRQFCNSVFMILPFLKTESVYILIRQPGLGVLSAVSDQFEGVVQNRVFACKFILDRVFDQNIRNDRLVIHNAIGTDKASS